jgi:hypothetical protein
LVKRALTLHPDTPGDAFSLEAKVARSGSEGLEFEFVVTGPVEELVLPPKQTGERADGLWKATCFEAFLKPAARTSYREFNFSPSSRWAAYEFENYREGMAAASGVAVDIHCAVTGDDGLVVTAQVTGPWLVGIGSAKLGLSAILEHADGTKSYWALAHPVGQPDFHDPACFAATIPATDAP